MTITRRQLVLLVAVTLMWGCNWPLMKISLREVPPLGFRALTMTGGVLLMAAWFVLRGMALRVPRGDWRGVIALALPNIVGWHLASIIGLTLLPAGRAAIRSMQGRNATWFCGAWMRNGFHEDGFASAVDVATAMRARVPEALAAE